MEHVHTALVDHVLTVTFNRPQKKNALTQPMYAAACDALSQSDQDDDIHVVLLRGTDGCFTAGNDVADFLQNPSLDDSPVVNFLVAISRAKKPMVAAVEGPAVGIGTTMLFHCDLVYAHKDTHFRMPFVPLGLVPEAASTFLLPRHIGTQRASELLLLGDSFDAATALELGFVNEVTDGDVYALAEGKAKAIAQRAPGAVQATKKLLRESTHQGVQEAITRENQAILERLSSPELMQAVQAFLQKG